MKNDGSVIRTARIVAADGREVDRPPDTAGWTQGGIGTVLSSGRSPDSSVSPGRVPRGPPRYTHRARSGARSGPLPEP